MKKRLPVVGDLVTFIKSLQYEGSCMILKPDPKMRFRSDQVHTTTAFIVLGRLGDAEYHAMKRFVQHGKDLASIRLARNFGASAQRAYASSANYLWRLFHPVVCKTVRWQVSVSDVSCDDVNVRMLIT
jgi:hypothetical protein